MSPLCLRSFSILCFLLLGLESTAQVQWQRNPNNPVVPAWSGSINDTNRFRYTYSPSVLYDSVSSQYKMWFAAAQRGESTFNVWYATSPDGITWSVNHSGPVLSVGPLGAFDSQWAMEPFVVRIDVEYRMYYTGYDGTRWQTGLATSPDGTNWTKYSGNPILEVRPGTWESVTSNAPKVYFNGSSYIMMYSGFDGINYNIGLATSTDGIQFTKHPSNPVLSRGNTGDWDANSVVTNALVYNEEKLCLFFSGGPYAPVGFATSTDGGVSWVKYPGNPVFTTGPSGSWDGSRVAPGSLMVTENLFKYWYTGYSSSRDSWQIGFATGTTAPSIGLRDTAAIWRFDETGGSLVRDDSPNHNDGTAYGTTIIPGRFSNARQFNGFNDYVWIGDPSNGSLDFANGQSFTIEAWFKTTSLNNQQILRKGLAPVQGYELKTNGGRVEVRVGNREDSHWPDTLLTIRSTNLFNDGIWHKATMVRDQTQRRLFLYVDGILAAPSIADPVQFSLSNDRAFTIGRWENPTLPTYFTGSIDEAHVFRDARHPATFSVPDIHVSLSSIDFGPVLVGSNFTHSLEIANYGGGDDLLVTGMNSTNPVFTSDTDSMIVPSGQTRLVHLTYTPTSVNSDTGSLSIASNDPDEPIVQVRLVGRGYQAGAAPVITRVSDVPGDQGKQVRVIWYRSMFDAPGDSVRITTYGVWRRVDDPGTLAPPQGVAPGTVFSCNGHTLVTNANELWDFLATIPAVQFDQYAYVAPTLYDSTHFHGIRWSVFKVSAHAANGEFYFSDPDSGYSADNIPPSPPLNLSGNFNGSMVHLAWDTPPDTDLSHYTVHRSTIQGFIPDATTAIGSPHVNSFVDTSPGGSPAVYYRVVSFDSAGNQSACSNLATVLLTGVGGGDFVPEVFALNQNYPNPFNPKTIISYDVPVASHVTLSIFDVNGREVQRLVNGFEQPGRYFVTWKPRTVASGIYLCRMIAGSASFTRKLVIIK